MKKRKIYADVILFSLRRWILQERRTLAGSIAEGDGCRGKRRFCIKSIFNQLQPGFDDHNYFGMFRLRRHEKHEQKLLHLKVNKKRHVLYERRLK